MKNRYRVRGVNRDTHEDVDWVIPADSDGNARVKAELLDVIVTDIHELDGECEKPSSDSVQRSDVFEYAGFWKRALAFVIDQIILAIPALFLGAIVAELLQWHGDHVYLVSTAVLYWLYHAGLEASSLRATFGKSVLGLTVTGERGERIGFAKATGRHLAKLLSVLFAGLGFIMAAFTARKQALHDIIAGCLVLDHELTSQYSFGRNASDRRQETAIEEQSQGPPSLPRQSNSRRRWGVYFATLLGGAFVGVIMILVIEQSYPELGPDLPPKI